VSADEWFDAHPNPMFGGRAHDERTKPMNAKLLRAVLTFIEDHPEQFDVTTYGETGRPCGPVTDVAGRALLESGWTLVADNTFKSPDGSREISGYEDIEREAQAALGLTDEELWDGGDLCTLFDLDGDEAVKRLYELAEQAEAAVANA
jgi:hypothetical protein